MRFVRFGGSERIALRRYISAAGGGACRQSANTLQMERSSNTKNISKRQFQTVQDMSSFSRLKGERLPSQWGRPSDTFGALAPFESMPIAKSEKRSSLKEDNCESFLGCHRQKRPN